MIVVLACALPLGADDASHHDNTNASAKARKSLRPRTAKPEQSALPVSSEQPPLSLLNVTYRDGQLTIVAENSTLADILSVVRSQTGAILELPPGSGSDRVASRIGPGPARDVLAALLNGSRFDYVITGSLSNPAGIERIILIPRSDGSERTPAMANPATNAKAELDAVGDASAKDDSEQPTSVMTSEAQEPPREDGEQPQLSGQGRSGWRTVQVFPQQPAPVSQQPAAVPQQPAANSPTTPTGLPKPPLPH